MSLINSASWKCDYPDCGHEWLAKPVDGSWVSPEKCAKCRRRGWDFKSEKTVQKQFIKAAPRVIAQATEPEYERKTGETEKREVCQAIKGGKDSEVIGGYQSGSSDVESNSETVKRDTRRALNIPGVKLGKDAYKPYVPEKYRKGEKSKFFKS